jgi:homoserine dehydrogenase
LRAELALIGFGHVGQRFALLLDECSESLHGVHDLDCHIVGIATSHHGCLFDRQGIAAREAVARRSRGERLGTHGTAADLIRTLGASDAPLRVVIETTTLNIVDGQPAISHVDIALDAGCNVVTANKGPAAFAYNRLMNRAQERGLSFLFEGAVMDGVPIFNLVRETLPAVKITAFRGIVNTTTQHILTAVEQGEAFASALVRMQAEGIAEADPSLDIDGWDAAAKTAALANVWMDANLTPHNVARDALTPSTADAAKAAMAAGRRLRLVASANRDDTGVRASVRLIELEAPDILATLPSTANALIVRTDLLGDIAICQMAGDLTQTAYALLSDLVTVRTRMDARERT